MLSVKPSHGPLLKLLGLLLLGLIFTSCPNPSASVQTIAWQLDGKGFVQYSTNDSQYYNYSFWDTYTQEIQTPMTTVTATVVKMSGSQYAGYGIIFCYQDNSNFYRLLIDAAGQYSVYKKVAGTYTALVPWTTNASPNLATGLGASNVISVTQSAPTTGSFSVFFNSSAGAETTFTDSSFTGGAAGFATGIYDQSHENFPNTPEDTRFKMTLPVAYP